MQWNMNEAVYLAHYLRPSVIKENEWRTGKTISRIVIYFSSSTTAFQVFICQDKRTGVIITCLCFFALYRRQSQEESSSVNSQAAFTEYDIRNNWSLTCRDLFQIHISIVVIFKKKFLTAPKGPLCPQILRLCLSMKRTVAAMSTLKMTYTTSLEYIHP